MDLCGIAGFTHKNWSPDSDRIRRAAATLVHRGPDQQGVFQSQLCSLGATRLKIIDLEGGDQPIIAQNGDAVIVFNGEIYNHLELRAELETLGHRFRSHSDTETILHAFLEWDTRCFSRLRGMFAIALWTESARRLVLARDRLGIKPLYLARLGQDLLFGSELKALFIHPEVERHLSLAGLDCYLSLNYVPCPWTLVEGIEKLPPGHWLEWRDGKVQSDCYWQLPFESPRNWTLDSAKEQLDSLLQQSTREHLLSDVPLGVWLSGGVDSSTILHYAAQASTSRLKTFSISFRGRSFDESAYIRQVVDHYQTEHEELDLTPEADLAGAIQEFAYYSDEPTADAGALPVWFLSKMCKRSTTVALSGEGADELFGGYLTYRANALAQRSRHLPSSVARLAIQAIGHWPVSDDKISFEYKLKRFLEGSLMAPERAHAFWNGTFSDAGKRSLLQTPLPPALDAILAELRAKLNSADPLAPYLWFDQKYYLPGDILTKVDRISMAHSVEVRPPFLDHRIVEFAATLPASLKIRGSRQKFILKQLMQDKLPPAVLQRKKVGFDIPAHQWLRGPLRSLLTDTVNAGLAEHPGLFQSKAVQSLLQAHMERRANFGYHLWGLLILFLWMKEWRIQATPSPASRYSAPERTGIST
ncbi:MAG: asparagine synthase (glutamine-hydrolyzing) [Candidatus Acidiferrales bacterium]